MAVPLATRMTLDEFLALPETKPYREFVGGRVIEKSMPNPFHGAAVIEIGGQLRSHVLASGPAVKVWTEVRHADRDRDRIYLPDVSVTLKSRLTPYAGGPVEVHPDLAIEVLSPTDEAGDVMDKIDFYREVGVPIVWVIDPVRKVLREYRSGQPDRLFRPGAKVSATPVLPGFELDLDQLFAAIDEAAS